MDLVSLSLFLLPKNGSKIYCPAQPMGPVEIKVLVQTGCLRLLQLRGARFPGTSESHQSRPHPACPRAVFQGVHSWGSLGMPPSSSTESWLDPLSL